ncbi:unnamed protein product [Linum tenue]|uniref:Mut7-C RNAse domain-containing protein n=1 Tax=Linum tenue TaxID=586396 RepID=A0AAV0IKN7_9ROSI|nr:unnamed protein product [Linum tenue]
MVVILGLTRWSHIWTSLVFIIICSQSNQEESYQRKQRVWQLYAKRFWEFPFLRNFNVVIGPADLLLRNRKPMLLQMHIVCFKFLIFSRKKLPKKVLEQDESGNKHMRIRTYEALAIVRATVSSKHFQTIVSGEGVLSRSTSINTMPMDGSLLRIVRKYGEKILLRESDRKPRSSKKRGKRKPPMITQVTREKWIDDNVCSWEGSTPWELSEGGDGCPKFLCDVMVEGLAKHLRCVGIDAAIPWSRKPDPRELIDQAHREKRVVLTRDAKLLRHQHLIKNQIYRVKSLLKNEQLLEVIETFNLKISENQLMSRCTKCNGKFIQKPLTTEEAVEAAKGFQKIPSCLFNKNLEFWQCMECNQLYWEGTQYHNAVQKFVDICKLNE